MIFQHTWEHVLNGTKTQTRRIVKPNERQWRDMAGDDFIIMAVKRGDGTGWVNVGDPIVYEVGKSYAVQPGRGKKSIARIKITTIRRHDVRQISEHDALAEGGFDPQSYLCLWSNIHDKKLKARFDSDRDAYQFGGYIYVPADNRAELLTVYNTRLAIFYDAWVLDFERCE